MATPKHVLERYAGKVTLHRGMLPKEREACRARLGLPPFPPEIEELLAYAEGFELNPPYEAVTFRGDHLFGFEEALPLSVPVLPDGFGNFWVVDVNPQSGAWGTVFFSCHDPSVLVVQAPDLTAFITQLLDPMAGDMRAFIKNEATNRILDGDPWLHPVNAMRASADDRVRQFAQSLPDNFRIADLREREIGSGFAWNLNSDIRRSGNELIFGIGKQTKRSGE
jgi:hypothetical protein